MLKVVNEINEDYLEKCVFYDSEEFNLHYELELRLIKSWYAKNKKIYTALLIDNEVAGYILAIPLKKETYHRLHKGIITDWDIPKKDIVSFNSKYLYGIFLDSIYVHPNYRGNGYSKLMISKFKEKIKPETKNILSWGATELGCLLLNKMGLKCEGFVSNKCRLFESKKGLFIE